eukprot:COSAG05_NODE_1149_length_5724_cov_5.331200_1_plen_84_part_10
MSDVVCRQPPWGGEGRRPSNVGGSVSSDNFEDSSQPATQGLSGLLEKGLLIIDDGAVIDLSCGFELSEIKDLLWNGAAVHIARA